jgi:hypothetical protein
MNSVDAGLTVGIQFYRRVGGAGARRFHFAAWVRSALNECSATDLVAAFVSTFGGSARLR